jgi:MFS family permease
MLTSFRLASGCTLLLAGSIADFVGNRLINLCGCFLLGSFILASGLAKTGIQLVIFRALQGIAVSMCFPTSFSILTNAFPNGRTRNIAFGCLGLSQPLGWSVGLFLGGVFESTPLGWRLGFYFCAGLTILLSGINCWTLPRDGAREPATLAKLAYGIDWIGVLLSSTCLGMLSYVFA